MPATQFNTVLRDELAELRPDLAIPANANVQAIYAEIDESPVDTAALCLSGGGIRSAAFALGVLQGLARFGLLDKFHYLSTVSGGGYIGSWLTAWRHYAASDKAVSDALDRTIHPDGAEADEIRGLRADSNYLTPKIGVLSADTWAAVALFVRNLVLNWLVFLPFFMGVLYFPWLCDDLLKTIFHAATPATPFLWIGVIAVTLGLAFASYGRRRASGRWLTDGYFVVLVLGPVIVAAMAFTAAAATPFATTTSTCDAAHGGLVCHAFALLPANTPASCYGAIGGMICYAVAWLIAGAVLAFQPIVSPARAAWVDNTSRTKDLFAWTAAGAVAGWVLITGMQLSTSIVTHQTKWMIVLGSSWTMLSIFAGELLYVGLRSYAKRGDMDREWLGRASGWLAAGAVVWAAFAALALAGPFALTTTHTYIVTGFTATGGISGVIALVFGSSAKTAATTASQAASRLSMTQIASLAGIVFAVFLAACLSFLDGRLSNFVMAHIWHPLPWRLDACEGAALIVFSAVASWFVNVNRFSLHALYRNRLVRAFLGSARAHATPPRVPDPFTMFDQADNLCMAHAPTNKLLHVVNIALNVVSTKNLAWQERRAESFTVTPLSTGSPIVGYRKTAEYGSKDGGITLGTAMAISGAAVSPNMGYHSSPILGFLLMLFNIRLGWWLGNPDKNTYNREGPDIGIAPLLKELVGRTTDQGKWVYLSDGGHFENLGLYEMIRRRCRIIVVSDAACDPTCAFEDLGNAVRKIYIDQGVSIDFDALKMTGRQAPKAGPYCATAQITYPGSTRHGWLLYIKPGYHGDEPAHIRSYAAAHGTFPHETTANQWFSESQFEAYRGLGAHIAELICSGGAGVPAGQSPAPIDLAQLKISTEAYLNGVAMKSFDPNAE